MKIIILSQIDYAGSAFRMFNAIKRHTTHDINLFSGQPDNRLGHPLHNLVTDANRAAVQRLVDDADLLHFKGDWSPVDGYLGLRIPAKPIVITTSGSFFRKKEHGGIGRYCAADYHRATLKTSFEPDLLYPEFSDIWTPHPIDSEAQPVLWHNHTPPVFMHIPSSPERKGTDFVKRVFTALQRRIKCETHVITGVTFAESLAAKQRATVYFDQFIVGFYGNAALEAMQYGIPVCSWISPLAIMQAKGKLKGCPVLNEDATAPEQTADRVLAALHDATLSARTKRWCDSLHGYKSVAARWEELYKQCSMKLANE